MKHPRILSLAAVTFQLAAAHPANAESAEWTTVERNGRIEASFGGAFVAAWQEKALANPTGGGKFASSAFLHPLRTPSGFECTAIQPADHLHHFGLWWPWKYIEVGGRKYNTWEIQEGEGAHRARTAKLLAAGPDKLEWELLNETIVRRPGEADLPVIAETAHACLTRRKDAQVVDITLDQKPMDRPVRIVDYRYSGFSWRGPLSWNKDNSTMTTSSGKARDDSNGTTARWVMVSGPTPMGSATVLLMSAAIEIAGTEEKLRVWDSKNHNGMPFVNFNPVMSQAQPLDPEHPAVSRRNYRVIAADRTLSAAQAEAEWKTWRGR